MIYLLAMIIAKDINRMNSWKIFEQQLYISKVEMMRIFNYCGIKYLLYRRGKKRWISG